MADKIDIFTAALRNEFITAYNAVPDPAPIDVAVTKIPSTAREENYSWLSPVPGFDQWKGHRRYGKISEIKYKLPNVTYDAAFEVLKEDLDDDQVGGYLLKASELGEHARVFPGEQCLTTLAAGQTTTCFDGTNFFNATHTIGTPPTGGNIVTGTAAAADAVTHAMVCLVVAGKIKPLLWQTRDGPDLDTDAGTKEAAKARIYRYWGDLRGAAGFGYWWDAILVKWTNTPTVAEMQTTLGNVEARFRQFQLPKNLASDKVKYPHGQIEFNAKNLVCVCSTKVGHILRQALNLSLIGNSENIYKGFATQVTAGQLDDVT